MPMMTQTFDRRRPLYESSSTAQPSPGSTPQSLNKAKSPKTKRTFRLAYPPPAKHQQRLSIRPRLLLQLHQTSTTSRPVPMFDVIPSGVFAPKFARRFPRIFRGMNGLSADDLMVVRSPKYEAIKDELDVPAEDEHSDARELVAAICQTYNNTTKGCSPTEILFNDGRSCQVVVGPNRRYDFKFVNKEGLQATGRWVPRRTTPSRARDCSKSEPEQAKHTFSLINPDTRRHAVIATLSRDSIEVCDRYSAPQAQVSPKSPARSSATSSSSQEDDCDSFRDQAFAEPGTVVVDENLRTLIIVSGIWVAFQEGYSLFHDGSRLSPPVTLGTKSPRFFGIQITNSMGTQSASPELQGKIQPCSNAGGLSSSGTGQQRPSPAATTRPTLSRASTTGSSNKGEWADGGDSQHFRRGWRRNTVSSTEKHGNAIRVMEQLRGTAMGKDSTIRQPRGPPEECEGHEVRPGKIKRLLGLARE